MNFLTLLAVIFAQIQAPILTYHPHPATGIVLLASVVQAGNGTSGAINCTGATLFVATVSDDQSAATISDSSSNTWNNIAPLHSGNQFIAYAYSKSGGALVSSSSQTFSYSKDAPYVIYSCYSGTLTGATNPFDSYTDVTASTTTAIQTGSLTPAQSGELLVSSLGAFLATGTFGIDSGFTILAQSPVVGGSNFAGSGAYLVQSVAAPINPTWTSSISANLSPSMASFKHP